MPDTPMTDAPERIWLQHDPENVGDGKFPRSEFWDLVTWCASSISDSDIEYVRADRARIATAMDAEPVNGTPITMIYRNYRGDVDQRTIVPARLWFGSTDWHPEPGWLLSGYDLAKAAHRDFALADCQFADIASGQQVRVRPLAWDDFDGRGAKATAFLIASYMITRWYDGRFEISVRAPGYSTGFDGDRFHPSLDAAKAAAQADYERRILAALTPAPDAAYRDEVQCDTCAGNGEIVTDWGGYLHPPGGAPADHAVADCPDCDGSGWTPAPAAKGTEAVPVAWTGNGSLMALADGREGFMWPAKADVHPLPLYTHPAPPAPWIAEAITALRDCYAALGALGIPADAEPRSTARKALRALANGDIHD